MKKNVLFVLIDINWENVSKKYCVFEEILLFYFNFNFLRTR